MKIYQIKILWLLILVFILFFLTLNVVKAVDCSSYIEQEQQLDPRTGTSCTQLCITKSYTETEKHTLYLECINTPLCHNDSDCVYCQDNQTCVEDCFYQIRKNKICYDNCINQAFMIMNEHQECFSQGGSSGGSNASDSSSSSETSSLSSSVSSSDSLSQSSSSSDSSQSSSDSASFESSQEASESSELCFSCPELCSRNPPENDCNGECVCPENYGTCVHDSGIREIINETSVYCFKGLLLEQKESNEECQNHFECKGNLCIEGKCETAGLLKKLLDWFKRLFG